MYSGGRTRSGLVRRNGIMDSSNNSCSRTRSGLVRVNNMMDPNKESCSKTRSGLVRVNNIVESSDSSSTKPQSGLVMDAMVNKVVDSNDGSSSRTRSGLVRVNNIMDSSEASYSKTRSGLVRGNIVMNSNDGLCSKTRSGLVRENIVMDLSEDLCSETQSGIARGNIVMNFNEDSSSRTRSGLVRGHTAVDSNKDSCSRTRSGHVRRSLSVKVENKVGPVIKGLPDGCSEPASPVNYGSGHRSDLVQIKDDPVIKGSDECWKEDTPPLMNLVNHKSDQGQSKDEPVMKGPDGWWKEDISRKNKSSQKSDLVKNKDEHIKRQLPDGWRREDRPRRNGSTNKTDPYYIDPVNGYEFRSMKDVHRYIKSGDIKQCSFRPKKRTIQDVCITDNQAHSIDLARIDRIVRCSLRSQGGPVPVVQPVPESSVATVDDRSPEDKERWWRRGLKAIAEGKLAVVLLAGGQGTRLGSSDPKGCFSIGLPSGKSLFQLQAERILCVQKLAAQSTDAPGNTPQIHWYIMTSPFTDETTRKFFESRRYFGLEPDQVTFFQQGTLPCVSPDGRFIMETPYKVARAPDGNGGVYAALKSKRLLDDMSARGVKYIDCYGVDNVLVRVADPTFLGYFIDKGVSAAAKVVRKAYPQEKVGVFVQRGRGGPLSVVEYSEMDASMTTEINQTTGRLRYCWSNVCLHMFSLEFLNQVTNSLEKDSVYHLADKKIPSIHGYTAGLKLEQFIFDVFTYSPSTALFEVMREEEFAPVKNANGATYDTPDSARLMLLRLHSRWVVAAGGFLTHSVPLYMTGVEVSPMCSYAGENLEAICHGRTFHAPSEISL